MLSYSVSLEHIPTLAKKIAKGLKGGEILALIGPLGSGKTTFTKALALGLGIKSRVTSPTFTIMNRYQTKLHGKILYVYHLDLYRTNNLREIKALGLFELWGLPNTVTVVEWADKIKKKLPNNAIKIDFHHL